MKRQVDERDVLWAISLIALLRYAPLRVNHRLGEDGVEKKMTGPWKTSRFI